MKDNTVGLSIWLFSFSITVGPFQGTTSMYLQYGLICVCLDRCLEVFDSCCGRHVVVAKVAKNRVGGKPRGLFQVS